MDVGILRDLGEGAVPVVAIEQVRLHVIGADQVQPAVVVRVPHHHAERLADRLVKPRLLRHIGKGAAAVVPVERRRLALVIGRPAHVLPAKRVRADLVQRRRPAAVVAHEQVQAPVPVVVEPGGAGAEGRARRLRRPRHVRESAIAIVPEQVTGTIGGQV